MAKHKKEHEKKEHHKKEHKKKEHMKKGGHVEGEKSKHHMHKYARGGATKSSAAMTPSSPLSGAGKMKDRAGMGSETVDKSDD